MLQSSQECSLVMMKDREVSSSQEQTFFSKVRGFFAALGSTLANFFFRPLDFLRSLFMRNSSTKDAKRPIAIVRQSQSEGSALKQYREAVDETINFFDKLAKRGYKSADDEGANINLSLYYLFTVNDRLRTMRDIEESSKVRKQISGIMEKCKSASDIAFDNFGNTYRVNNIGQHSMKRLRRAFDHSESSEEIKSKFIAYFATHTPEAYICKMLQYDDDDSPFVILYHRKVSVLVDADQHVLGILNTIEEIRAEIIRSEQEQSSNSSAPHMSSAGVSASSFDDAGLRR